MKNKYIRKFSPVTKLQTVCPADIITELFGAQENIEIVLFFPDTDKQLKVWFVI